MRTGNEPNTDNLTSPDRQELSPAEFTPKSELGKTTTSSVYLVESATELGDIAVKHPAVHQTVTLDGLETEAKQWTQLDDHNHIVGVIDWGSAELPWVHSDVELPWIAMEYMDGGDLSRYAGELSVDASLWIAEQLTDAVWYAHHHGIGGVHHDLKPANILFQTVQSSEWPVPKISDWELARSLLNHSDSVGVTTPPYIAPEQARDEETNQWTDQFQLGIVLFELFTGSHPFIHEPSSTLDAACITAILEEDPPNATTLRPQLPVDVNEILQRMLAKAPSDRFEAMLEARNRFQAIRRGAGQVSTATIDTVSRKGNTTEQPEDTSNTAATSSSESDTSGGDTASGRVLDSSSWEMFKGGRSRTGSLSGDGPNDSFTQQWSYSTNGELFSSPAVSADTIYIGSKDNAVYAIPQGGGTPRWKFHTGGEVYSSPALTFDTVYIGSNDGKVYAIDNTDGTEDWSYQTDKRIRSSPAVSKGTVYVGSWDSNVYALDKTTGEVEWSYQAAGKIDASPAVTGETLYITCREGYVYALDATNGGERWRPFDTESEIFSSPVVCEDTIFVGTREGHLLALDCKDGTGRWSYETEHWIDSSPAVVDGTVYFGSRSGSVYALDASSGSVQWEFDTKGEIHSTPAVADGIVYIASVFSVDWKRNSGNIHAIDADKGTEIARKRMKDKIMGSPAIAHGSLYVGCYDETLYAFSDTDNN